MAPYKSLYSRKCRSMLYWSALNERKLVKVDLVRETKDKVRIICDNLKITSDCQKYYAILKQKDIVFSVGDRNLRNIGPYEVLERIEPMAYWFALPQELSRFHIVFYVSMLRYYPFDPSHLLSQDEIELQPNLTYDEESVRILTREVKESWNKHYCGIDIELMKLCGKWKNLSYHNTRTNFQVRNFKDEIL
ncbi:Retrotransposon gag protein [Gossypium australe]|uniref:Retrotransposon gag protein n=1 Tax=Gossypium australe TaxID=47621 RepID=A0A5B6X586_9ROSI|nr:Retrotransposon gag protein [Gossypium australe]